MAKKKQISDVVENIFEDVFIVTMIGGVIILSLGLI
jgi:hypothetical protein